MNKFSWLSVVFYAAVLGCVAASDDFQCTPNETFKQDCNTCVCSSDGKAAACTAMGCLPNLPSVTLNEEAPTTANAKEPATTESTSEAAPSTESAVTESEHMLSNNHVCTPNDIKMEDCNRCRCAANGIGWFCTRRACPPKGFRKRAVQSPHSRCEPGKSWNDGCNDCFCTDNGIPVCTLMHCFGHSKLVKRSAAPPARECEPGSTWKDDCNTCFCSETGIAACTLKGCLKNFKPHNSGTSTHRTVTLTEYQDSKFTCLPSEAFKLECNTCRCGPDGKTTAWCTKKRCVDGE